MLTQMGVKAEIEGDEMVIVGHSLAQRLLCGRTFGQTVDGSTQTADGGRTELDGRGQTVDGVRPCGQTTDMLGLLHGGAYTSHHDHRMVMALKVASLGADSPITIDDEVCVAKSFPQFPETFAEMLQ
jgi:5-enolpyruvylshikimate-3-phosphate synthase